jgi:hypothetical protein
MNDRVTENATFVVGNPIEACDPGSSTPAISPRIVTVGLVPLVLRAITSY